MASQSKPTISQKNRVSQISTGDHTDVLMEILNKNYQESTPSLKSDGCQGKSSKKNNPRRSTLGNPNTRSVDIPNGRAPHKRFSTHERTPRPSNSYQRPTGPEIVRPHIPSCSSLPQNWCPIHDRFIAYLATHAPLTEKGKIPSKEELVERWKTTEIIRLIKERFPKLGRERVKVSVIEKRLAVLDEAGDNDYFKMRYGAYKSEEWGRGI